MSQSGYTPIQIYRSATPAAVPDAANLAAGELAINTADGILFYEDSGGTVKPIAHNITPVANGGTGSTTASGALTNFGLTATAAEINTLDGITATTTELNYTDGVTSNIQTQLNCPSVSSAPVVAFGKIPINNACGFV